MKTVNRVVTIMLIVLVSIGTLATINQPANATTRFFSATINPTNIIAHTINNYTITMCNTGTGYIGSLNITIPKGFSGISIKSLSPTTWTLFQQSSQKICLKPSHPSNTLGPEEVLTLSFSAIAPKTPGNYEWTIICNTNTGFGGKLFVTSDGTQPVLTLNPGPIIDLTPTFGQPDTLAKINGSLFTTESTISATLDGTPLTISGTLATDTLGSFDNAIIRIPSDANLGPHIVNLTDGCKNAWDVFSVTVCTTTQLTTNATVVNSGDSVSAVATLSGDTSDAGGTVTYTLYNETSIVLSNTRDVINGTVSSIIYQATYAGTYYFEAQYSGDAKNAPSTSDPNYLTVTHANPIWIAVTPKTPEAITAGYLQTFIAIACDGYNTWDTTSCSIWSINTDAKGQWNQSTGTYTSETAGTWNVTATLGELTDGATLLVLPGPLDHIMLAPKTATINASSSQTYTIEAFDHYGNVLGDVTASTVLNASGAVVNGNSISATPGNYVVTANYNQKTDTANLTVVDQTIEPTPTQTPTTSTPSPTSSSRTQSSSTDSSTSSTNSSTNNSSNTDDSTPTPTPTTQDTLTSSPQPKPEIEISFSLYWVLVILLILFALITLTAYTLRKTQRKNKQKTASGN